MYDTNQTSGHTIHAGHIEAPQKSFFVQWDAEAYNNVLRFAPGKRWARVLAETPEGALMIAEFHYGSRGKNFELLSEPPQTATLASLVNHFKAELPKHSDNASLIAPLVDWDTTLFDLNPEELPTVRRSSCPILLDSPPCQHYARRN